MTSKAAKRRLNRLNAAQGVNKSRQPISSKGEVVNAGYQTPGYRLDTSDGIELFTGPNQGYGGSRSITDIIALNLSGIHCAVTLIASTIAALPVDVVKTGSDTQGRSTTIVANDHPVSYLMNVTMDGQIPAILSKETGLIHSLLSGNSYNEIIRNKRGQAVELKPIHPRRVEPSSEKSTGNKIYFVQNSFNKTVTMFNDEIAHIPALALDGYKGISPIRLMSNTINLALSAQEYGNAFFETGGRPRGFLTKDGTIPKPQKEEWKQEWAEMHEGRNNWHSVGVLGGGLKWVNIGITPNEAQFIATRQFEIEEICRWFHTPPHMLMMQGKSTTANYEQGMIEFVIFCLLPWVKRIEGEYNMKLFTRVERNSFRIKINLNGLLRGDNKTRAEVCKTMVQNGAMTVNEWRDLEDRNFFEDAGDKPLVMASQLATLVAVEAGTNLNNPLKAQTDSTSSKSTGA